MDTYIDDQGKILLKCSNGAVNGYNEVLSYTSGCNTDLKHVGSGTFWEAVSIYVSDQLAKISLDSVVVISALSTGLQAVDALGPDRILTEEEPTRTLLYKTRNTMVGKRELSEQQVASALLGIPDRYTDASFSTVYWSPLLTWRAPLVFPPYKSKSAPAPVTDPDAAEAQTDDEQGTNEEEPE